MIQQNANIANKQLVSNQIDTLNYDKGDSVDKGNPNVIDIDKAIIVSDVHVGYEKSNVTAFADFLSDCISKDFERVFIIYPW
jgi:hypothetical protein